MDSEGASRPAAATTAAAPAQNHSSDQTEKGSGITEVHGEADLVLEPAGKERVVEVQDDVVGGPGHSDQAEDSSAEEANPPAERQGRFDQ